MNKLQILNETQVQHFYNSYAPILNDGFDVICKALKIKAEEIKFNFMTAPEVLGLLKEQEALITKVKALIEIQNQLKLIGDCYRIADRSWGNGEEYTEARLLEIIEANKNEFDNLLLRLAKKSLNVNDAGDRKYQMNNDLRTQLCLCKVDSPENIKKAIFEAIQVNKYFNFPI